MIIANLENAESSLLFEEQLQITTKTIIADACRFFGFSVPKSLRKKEFIASAAKAFLNHPEHWMRRLSKDEALLLRKLVEVGPNTSVEWNIGMIVNALETFDLLVLDETGMEQGLQRYMICDELREAVAPYIDNLFTSDKQQQQWEIEQYAYGLVNLYGLLPLSEVINKLYTLKKNTLSRDQLLEVIYAGSISRYMYKLVKPSSTTTYIQSAFLNRNDIELFLELQRKEIRQDKVFTDEEIYEAGRRPNPNIALNARQKVQNLLIKKLQMTETEAAYTMLLLWTDKQYGLNPMQSITSLTYGKLNSMNDLQSAINIFMEYLNAIPVWFLRGYSSEESSKIFEADRLKQGPPQIIAGPGLQALGKNVTADMQACINEIYRNEAMTTHKVGRNAPCPCGSGRKYKHCCGASN